MSTISANTLFHFTKHDNLLGILRNGFYPKYSQEEFCFRTDNFVRAAVPMVCFCDLPLSQVQGHMSQYGQYGIGMTKEWAKATRLNPVLYLQGNSVLAEKLDSVLTSNYDSITELGKLGMKVDSLFFDRVSLTNIVMHIKTYDGYQVRNGTKTFVRYYDEREWRYVPNILHVMGKEVLLRQDQYDEELLAQRNDSLKKHKLAFEAEDVEYLIISKEEERRPMIDEIKKITSRWASSSVDLLVSKMISAKQIMSDL